MTTDDLTAEVIEEDLSRFLQSRTKSSVAPDHDLFASGLVSSMFAMELVVQLESSYDIVIAGSDLKLDNFRTVGKMTELVLRLSSVTADHA